jgi:hypothetical protein
MKINFRQPKYIIPLITLPFLALGFFIFGGKISEDKKENAGQKTGGLNTNMPGVDTSISKGEIKDKFSAYQQAFKNVTDESAIAGIDKPGTGQQIAGYESSYSEADKERLAALAKMDSINQVLETGQKNMQSKMAQYNRTGGFGGTGVRKNRNGSPVDDNPSGDALLNKLLKVQGGNKGGKEAQVGDGHNDADAGSYDTQMRVFHEQMKFMDSMQRANGAVSEGEKSNTKSRAYTKEFNPEKDTSFKPLSISSAIARPESEFNTLRNFDQDNDNITAMIDQDVKATLGSRVRIRLLKDMYVGDYLIKSGTYIYGVVTGFQKQRVNISIARVLYNNSSLPVKIDLFDSDGYLGLYVPGSDFREFSKEIGTQATQGLSQVASTDNSNVKMNILSQLFNTTSTTLSNLIKKDKAFLKYNYIVYLKENKTSFNN